MPQLDDALLFTIDLMAVLDAHAEDIIGLGDEDTVVRGASQGGRCSPHSVSRAFGHTLPFSLSLWALRTTWWSRGWRSTMRRPRSSCAR